MKIQRNSKIWTLFIATFIIFAGVLFFEFNILQSEAACAGEQCTPEVSTGETPNVATEPDPVNGKFTWKNPIGSFLYAFLQFVGLLLNLAVNIFLWIADPARFPAVFGTDGGAIYSTWQMVRDLFNLVFMLILLFSAFATIFQVDSYNYKKKLLWIIIMALLVNFSYPITLFIIDATNSLMYTLLKIQFGNPSEILYGTSDAPTAFKGIEGMIETAGSETPNTSLLALIVFTFILALTILAMAILFIIRLIALAILVIFSPVAFVGFLLGKGSQWWDYLFKYAFFGPIMAFMLIVSSKLMVSTVGISSNIAGDLSNKMISTIIPIIILWIGMGVAQKMGIAGAAATMGRAQNVARGAGNMLRNGAMNASGINFIRRQAADYARERNARREQARFRVGRDLGRRVNAAQDNMVGRIPGRLGEDARRRNANTVRAANRENITNRTQDDARDGGTLLTDLNANINVALDPATNVADRRTHAVTAQALRNVSDSELHNHLDTNVAALYAQVASGDGLFGNVAMGSRIEQALNSIANGAGTNEDYNRVTGHIRSRATEAANSGVNAGI